MSFELDYTELDYVRRALSIPVLADIGERVTKNAALSVEPDALKQVQHYPPELPGQRYIRTGTYERSAYVEVSSIPDGTRLEFGSTGAIQKGRRYDPYLKDVRNQAGIHRGRWKTLSEDADALMPKVERELEVELTREGFV